jgi:RHS repeat-associated protein
VTPSSLRSPDECLAFDVSRGAAYECGDLRVVHRLPGITTYNKFRAPTLVYNSQLAHPNPVVAAVVELNSARGTPDSVVALVKNGSGATLGSTHFAGTAAQAFAGGAPRRVAVSWDGYGASTGENTWTFNVQAYYGSVDTAYTQTFYYALVNHQTSHLGAGWSIAGLESLTIYSNRSSFLWSTGDGESRYYQQVSGRPTVYATTNLARPDTILFDSTAGTWRYKRLALHGDTVVFDSIGRHRITIDRVGRRTTFTYASAPNSATDLALITLPGGSDTARYQFMYHATGSDSAYVDSIIAPPNGTVTRAVKITHDALHQVIAARDPDGLSVSFGYLAAYYVMGSRTDKRGTVVQFNYDGGRHVDSATIDPGATPHLAITTRFAAEESEGLITSVQPESASTAVQGPRLAGDSSRFWVDQFGEPFRIRDALEHETELVRGNATYPTLVTRLHTAGGQIWGAAYDVRGNDSSLTDSTTMIAGAYATTWYLFNPQWDFDTLTTFPLGETEHDGLDATGNRIWQQDGRGVVSRTTFSYSTTCVGLVQGWQLPVTARDSVIYDPVLCNVSAVRTPRGHYTSYTADGLGRTTLVSMPIDSNDYALNGSDPHEQMVYTYDVMDRELTATHLGPAVLADSAQSTIATTHYDPEGLVLSVDRTATGANTLHTATVYDAAERAITDSAVNRTVTRRAFDKAGNVNTLTTRRGYQITATYDALNRVLTRLVPSYVTATIDSGIPFSAADDTVRKLIAPFVPEIDSGYGGTLVHGDTVSFAYDALSHVVEADNVNARVSRTYFKNGAIASETQRLRTVPDSGAAGSFAAHVYQVGYHYDLDGRRDSLYFPIGLTVTSTGSVFNVQSYGYDSQTGWLRRITDAMANQLVFGYTVRGDPDTLAGSAADFWTEVRAYDDDGNKISSLVTLPPGDDLQTYRNMTMTYDARGKMLYDTNAVTIVSSTRFWYSGLGFVTQDKTQYTFPHDTSAGAAEVFTYDGLGNASSSAIVHVLPTGTPTQLQNTYNTFNTWNQLDSTTNLSSTPYQRWTYDTAGNSHFTTIDISHHPTEAQDRADFYTADDRLAESDLRTLSNPTQFTNNLGPYLRVDERYRYDALGRRVLVQTHKVCGPPASLDAAGQFCMDSLVRRTIWDGAQEVAEVQAPLADPERDTGIDTLPYAPVNLDGNDNNQDDNAFFGQVLYTIGPDIDKPLSVIRLNFLDRHDNYGGALTPFLRPPQDLFTLWSVFGHFEHLAPDSAELGGQWRYTLFYEDLGFPQAYNNVPGTQVVSWMGSLLEEKSDQGGTQYSRARPYDPNTGRFTQEDPIGLGGGLNAYGFANGDPISYSDPFGLCSQADHWTNCTDKDLLRPDRDPVLRKQLAAAQKRGERNTWLTLGAMSALGAVIDGGIESIKAAIEGAESAKTLEISFGHGARHLEGTGLGANEVESSIKSAVTAGVQGATETGNFWGRVTVDGVKIEYRAFTLSSGRINVGTYYPVP